MPLFSTLSLPWQAAARLAWEAYCAGSIPIGAVVADPQGRIVSEGRSRRNECSAPAPHVCGSPLAHAELSALLALDHHAVDPRQCILYTTTEPCPLCAGAIVMGNIRHVRYASRDPWAGSAGLIRGGNDYIRSKRIQVDDPADPRFEAALIALQYEFFLRDLARRGDPFARPRYVVDALDVMDPVSAALGERLFRSGELAELRACGASAAEVLDFLDGLLPRA